MCIELAEDGVTPFSKWPPMRCIREIPYQPPPVLKKPKSFSQSMSDFIAAALVKDPTKRQTGT